MRAVKEIWRSLVSIARFWKVMWRWRWYDYSYTVDFIEQDLRMRLKHWGKDTHYIGDKFTRGRILILLKNLDEYRDAGWADEPRLWRQFMRRYARTLDRLWD